MILIDVEGKLPTDSDVPEPIRWTKAKWDGWLAKSSDLSNQLAALYAEGKINDRNELIDNNSTHWGELKDWLMHLSHGKCWFSETKELFSHYDVEHFRPKKEAKNIGSSVRDGYWWLAFNYTNFRLCGNVGNRKKGGWFPLKAGTLCSTYDSQCEESEDPYLIDPIDSGDVKLIAFDEEGKVIAAPDCTVWQIERVKESAKRLKLNDHVPLTEARRALWQAVLNDIKEYQEGHARSGSGGNPAAREKMKAAMKKIRGRVKRSEPLSAVARWCVLVQGDPVLARMVE